MRSDARDGNRVPHVEFAGDFQASGKMAYGNDLKGVIALGFPGLGRASGETQE
jgi:hypothetical protein